MKAKTKCLWCKGIFDKKCFVELNCPTCANCFEIILKCKGLTAWNISVSYTEQELTADEIARKLGLWCRFGKRNPDDRSKSLDYPGDKREPEIWLSEMYEEGYNMDVLEGNSPAFEESK